jgi:shikimate kinase
MSRITGWWCTWAADEGPGIAWSYPEPFPEVARLAGYIAPVLDAWLHYDTVPERDDLRRALLAHFTGHLSISTTMRAHPGIGPAGRRCRLNPASSRAASGQAAPLSRQAPTPAGQPAPAQTRQTLGNGNMKRVLITGMSGTGKSSLLHELAARGYRTVDTDYGGYFETIEDERLWREDKINALLSSEPEECPGVLFVQGTTRNQILFYPRFDHIVLLSAPPDVLVQRLTTRTTNPYGKDPAEIAETLQYQQTVEPLLRAAATLEVVTTVPVARVAHLVLEHVLGSLAGAG